MQKFNISINFEKILNFFILCLGFLFLVKAYSSLSWRMEVDSPLLYYAAFLMEKYSLFPYRDIFETSMPGTFAFHFLAIKLFGYSDLSFRILDITLLGLSQILVFVFMRRFSWQVGILASLIFGSIYLSLGQTISLQRDYLGLIPIALSLTFIPKNFRGNRFYIAKLLAIGSCFGMAALFKPQLMIGLPITSSLLFIFHFPDNFKWRRLIRPFAVSILGSMIPIAIAASWLIKNDALMQFGELFFHYLPLHNALSGANQPIDGKEKFIYILRHATWFGGFAYIFLGSFFGIYVVLCTKKLKRETLASCYGLCLLSFTYAIYPSIAGKFWPYHFIPFVFFCCLSASLSVYFKGTDETRTDKAKRMISISFVAVILCAQLPLFSFIETLNKDIIGGTHVNAPRGGRPDSIGKWLKNHLQPGDTVQSLDWTGGVIHGMLIAQAKLATSFMYDYHFYHHLNSPYIQKLREQFLIELKNKNPRYIIEVTEDKPWVSGINTSREFVGLRAYLSECYLLNPQELGYVIYINNGKCGK